MKVLQGIRDLSRRSKRALAWDVFMVWVAIINLSLILFDLSYLWLRPTYFRYLPVVTRIYDPVKGIEHAPIDPEPPRRARDDAGAGAARSWLS